MQDVQKEHRDLQAKHESTLGLADETGVAALTWAEEHCRFEVLTEQEECVE